MQRHDNIPETAAAKAASDRGGLIGICGALGQDLGVNADYLRVALAVTLLFSPELAVTAYGACGLLVLISRQVVRRLVPMPALVSKAVIMTLASSSPRIAPEPAPNLLAA